eukprot:COSAG05_NODE_388_length_10440_cov_10.200677_3_plen_81_part_00
MILGYDEYSHKLSHTYYDIDLRFSKIIPRNLHLVLLFSISTMPAPVQLAGCTYLQPCPSWHHMLDVLVFTELEDGHLLEL